MNRTKLNYWIDVGLAISFLISFITGLIKWPGAVNVIGVSVYRALNIRKISMLHDRSGLVMSILVIVHIVLHWKWIVAVTKSFFKKDKK